jgi:parallel beta-helix repeat protein
MCKKVLGGFLCIFLFLLFAAVPTFAQKGKVRPTVWDVYPAMDRLQIQAFVDSASDGDTIYFRAGTYDWKLAPTVPSLANEGAIKIIDKTLTIKGEPGNLIIGPDSYTDINNVLWGLNAFHVLDEDIDNDVTFVGLNIQHFRRGIAAGNNSWTLNPFSWQRDFWNARNITIKNCTISDMAGQAVALSGPAGNVTIENNIFSQIGRMAIWLTYRGLNYSDSQPDGSRVQISGNTITSALQGGLYTERTKNFRFEKNTMSILGPAMGGAVGITIYGAKKGTVISGNSISNYHYGIYGEASSESYPAENMIIDNNKISCVSPVRGWCYGILLDYDFSSGHIVTRNEINLTSTIGIGIYSEVNHSLYSLNKISGTGRSAIELNWGNYSPVPVYAHHELFLSNDVSQFTPSEAHYYLENGTHDNTIFGFGKSPWTYKDYGINNLFIGGTNITFTSFQALSAVSAVPPAPGEGLREARKNIIF